MPRFRQPSRLALWIVILALLAGCGGGGASGSGAGGNNNSSVSLSASGMSFSVPDRSAPTPAPQKVQLTVTNGTVLFETPQLSTGSLAFAGTSLVITGPSTAEVTVFPQDPNSLSVGTHTDVVRIVACSGGFCSGSNEIPGSPITIPVTYQVDGYVAFPSLVNLTAIEGSAPAPFPVQLSHSTGSRNWSSSLQYLGTGPTGWLSLSQSSGSILPATTELSATSLDAGVYDAFVRIDGPGGFVLVGVNYSVLKALAAVPSSASYAVGAPSTPSELARDIVIQSQRPIGSPAIPWSATANVPWIVLNRSSGDTALQSLITVSVDPSQLGSLQNGRHSASISITSTSANVSPISIPITMELDRPQVSFVSPYVAAENSSGEVILRGDHFAQASITQVDFGGIDATSFRVISDTEIRATHPPLPAGSYPVGVSTTGTSLGSAATLVVMPAVASSITTGTVTSLKHGTWTFDQERRAMLVGNVNTYERHAYTGAGWTSLSRIPAFPSRIPGNPPVLCEGIALSADGKDLFVLTADRRIGRLDPVTLLEKSTSEVALANVNSLQGIFATSDGNVLILVRSSVGESVQLHKYEPRNDTLTKVGGFNYQFAVGAISGDANRILILGDVLPSNPSLQFYDASSGTLSSPVQGVTSGGTLQLDRTGARIMIGGTLFDQSLNEIGSVGPVVGGSCTFNGAAVLSPDGTRAYRPCDDLNAIKPITTYDLTAPAPFAVSGTVTLIGAGSVNQSIIAGDGTALLILTDSQLNVIQPAP